MSTEIATSTELTGTIRSLLDEYRKAVEELITVINPLSSNEIILVRDHQTMNADCRSVQAILSHIVYAGYGYTNFIEKSRGSDKPRRPKLFHQEVQPYLDELVSMVDYCEDFFVQHPSIPLEEKDNSKKITTHWGQQYDVEQLMEHAIVHILKHRRQIRKMITVES